MTKIFLDDLRPFDTLRERGYECVKTFSDCKLLLSIFKNDIETINLDYDLGSDKTGLDVLIYMDENHIYPKKIIIHSTHFEGVKKMEDYIKMNFPNSQYTYSPAKDV